MGSKEHTGINTNKPTKDNGKTLRLNTQGNKKQVVQSNRGEKHEVITGRRTQEVRAMNFKIKEELNRECKTQTMTVSAGQLP